MNFEKLRDFLDYYLPMLGIPGSDTVIYRNHEEIFRYTSGFDDLAARTPVKKDALYNVYSCTKLATCVAALQLVERGEILIDDPVYVYIPEYKNLRVLRTSVSSSSDTVPAEKPLLIRHLLTMTSGFDYSLNRPSIERVRLETEGRCPTLEVIKALASDTLDLQPGSKYLYGLSYDILGGVIEAVSGMTLEEYMYKNIFTPLGMKDTTFKIAEKNSGRLAMQYEFDAVGRCAVAIGKDSNPFRPGDDYCGGGSGLISSVDDFILLIDALANGGVGKNGNRILSCGAVDLLRTPSHTNEQKITFESGINKGYDYCYGARVLSDASVAGTLAPAGVFGWDSERMCLYICDPKNRIAIFHAEQIDRMNSIVVPRLINVVYSCIDEDLL